MRARRPRGSRVRAVALCLAAVLVAGSCASDDAAGDATSPGNQSTSQAEADVEAARGSGETDGGVDADNAGPDDEGEGSSDRSAPAAGAEGAGTNESDPSVDASAPDAGEQEPQRRVVETSYELAAWAAEFVAADQRGMDVLEVTISQTEFVEYRSIEVVDGRILLITDHGDFGVINAAIVGENYDVFTPGESPVRLIIEFANPTGHTAWRDRSADAAAATNADVAEIVELILALGVTPLVPVDYAPPAEELEPESDGSGPRFGSLEELIAFAESWPENGGMDRSGFLDLSTRYTRWVSSDRINGEAFMVVADDDFTVYNVGIVDEDRDAILLIDVTDRAAPTVDRNGVIDTQITQDDLDRIAALITALEANVRTFGAAGATPTPTPAPTASPTPAPTPTPDPFQRDPDIIEAALPTAADTAGWRPGPAAAGDSFTCTGAPDAPLGERRVTRDAVTWIGDDAGVSVAISSFETAAAARVHGEALLERILACSGVDGNSTARPASVPPILDSRGFDIDAEPVGAIQIDGDGQQSYGAFWTLDRFFVSIEGLARPGDDADVDAVSQFAQLTLERLRAAVGDRQVPRPGDDSRPTYERLGDCLSTSSIEILSTQVGVLDHPPIRQALGQLGSHADYVVCPPRIVADLPPIALDDAPAVQCYASATSTLIEALSGHRFYRSDPIIDLVESSDGTLCGID